MIPEPTLFDVAPTPRLMSSGRVEIVLPDELAIDARLVGEARASRAEAHGWTRNVHTKADNHDRHVQAAGSEAAVAYWLGQKWVSDLNAFRKQPDVLPDIEVRRISKRGWRLPVYRDDDPTRRFVLTFGTLPAFQVIGWIRGADARLCGSWEDQHNTGVGAWFVSQKDLHDPSELIP